MPRFFLEQPLDLGLLDLPAPVVQHLQVLRLQVGDTLHLFNGQGGMWLARLERLERRQAQVQLLEFEAQERESPRPITLLQGVASLDRMDSILQKATELGVHTVQPVLTQRVETRLNAERWAKKIKHWQGVLQASCEQCGRNRLPVLAEPIPLRTALSLCHVEHRWVLDPSASLRLAEGPAPAGAMALLVGPEGGLTAEELAWAQQAGWQGRRFGPRILRTETAGPAALAVLQHWAGDC